jgi:uncharacterized heparinase superfamily protein
MNPMVFTILAWEREMELRCQAHKLSSRDSAAFSLQDRKPRRADRRSVFARLFGFHPRPSCECS